jgi:hypothetical protein
MRQVAAAVAAGVLAGCSAVSAAAANAPPLKAYTGIQPSVNLFGDTIRARLTIVAATAVDPALLRASATFAPYVPVAPLQRATVRAGGVEQLTWTWTLRCLSATCLPGKLSHVFRFPQAHIRYLRPDGAPAFRLAAVWPRVEVFSRLSPGVARDLRARQRYDWRYSVAPVAAPTFRVRPALLFWLAIGVAAALAAGALALAARWYAAISPRRAAAPASAGTPLARALSLLAWAHTHGNENLQRKALARVGDELGVVRTKNGLSETARELAWRPELPDDAEVQAFARQAQEAESESSG